MLTLPRVAASIGASGRLPMNRYAIALCVACAFVSPAQANLLNSGDTLTDTDTGLTWLNLTATEGRSVGEVLSLMDPGELFHGYRLATGSEILTLWSHANVSIGAHRGAATYINIQSFQAAIGITHVQQDGQVRNTWGLYEQGTPGLYGAAQVETSVVSGLRSSAFTLANFSNGLVGTADTGVWLVSAPVPEPSTWALWAAGLGLFGLRARRRSHPA